MGREVIIVTDMMAGFLDEGYPLYCGGKAREIVPQVVSLLKSRHRTTPVYVNDNHAPNDPEFDQFPPHCIAGTEETALVEELRPFPGDVIPKTKFSAFFGTQLDDVLRVQAPTQVVLTGVCTDICIMYTAADLRNRGYRVVVPSDCVASFNEDNHHWALKHMAQVLGAIVVPSWRDIPAAPEPPVVIAPAPAPEPAAPPDESLAPPLPSAAAVEDGTAAERELAVSDSHPATADASDWPMAPAADAPADESPAAEQPAVELPASIEPPAELLASDAPPAEPPAAEPPAPPPLPRFAPLRSADPMSDTNKILRIAPEIRPVKPADEQALAPEQQPPNTDT